MSVGRSWLFPLIILVALAYLALQALTSDGGERERVRYSELVARVTEEPRAIRDVFFRPRNQSVVVTLTDGTELRANYPSDEAQYALQQRLEEARIAFDSAGTGEGFWSSLLVSLLPFVILIAFWVFLMQRVGSAPKEEDDTNARILERLDDIKRLLASRG